jgi:putative nucleotidyltransferase with HDIG domain
MKEATTTLATPAPGEDGPPGLDAALTEPMQGGHDAEAGRLLERSEKSRRALLSLLEDQRRVEAKLRKVNRALETLSAGNEALVRAHDEDSLMHDMMRILGAKGGYPMAWVGYARDDDERSVEPKATLGLDAADLNPPVSWADNARGQSAVGRAIRLGTRQIIRNEPDDPGYVPWQTLIRNGRILAMLGLPLRLAPGERPFAALGIASRDADAFDDDEIRLLEELARDLAYGIANLRNAAARRKATEDLRESLESAVGAIAATLEARDPYTAGHQRRVAELAAAIGREMRLAPEVVRGLHFGALIHDVGKIQVPAELLSKPTRLTPLEFEFIKTHPQAGYEIVRNITFPWPVADMVRQHHERLDGSGYPQGLKGDAIALEARLIAVADVVEAMASHRPYRASRGIEAALRDIEARRGTWFEPAAVDACVRLFRAERFDWNTATA